MTTAFAEVILYGESGQRYRALKCPRCRGHCVTPSAGCLECGYQSPDARIRSSVRGNQ